MGRPKQPEESQKTYLNFLIYSFRGQKRNVSLLSFVLCSLDLVELNLKYKWQENYFISSLFYCFH